MGKNIFFIIIAILIFAGIFTFNKFNQSSLSPLNPTPNPSTKSASDQKSKPDVEIIARSLEIPWALDFLPDGAILFTERPGKIRLIDSSGNLQSKPIATLTDVKPVGEGGLLGLALDPDFASNHFIYLYYTYSSNGLNTLNRVVRFIYDPPAGGLKNQTIIVDNIPGSSNHNGGRIKFGPDKNLYITTGDAQNPSQAQDKNSLAGKILRIVAGKIEIYSYGHRNPQGLTWDNDGNLWEVEHGQTATDEVNKITPGKNYGWPIIRGDEIKPGMENPVEHSGTATWAPAGLAFHNSSFFFGGLRGQALYELRVDGEYPDLKEHFKSQFGRIRDVVLGPDNMLYITTSNRDGRGTPAADDDKIIKINPDSL